MLLRTLVVVGLVGLATLSATRAAAQESAPQTVIGVNGVTLDEPAGDLDAGVLRLDIAASEPARFSNFEPTSTRAPREADRYRGYEVSLTARAAAGMDVALAQSGGVSFNADGDVSRQSRSAELRLGRGLRNMARADGPSPVARWYFFAASEDEALIWSPGPRTNAFGGAGPAFALQDRVEIGDIQAGVTYEIHGLQASLAYVEREVSVRAGSHSVSQDERFAGFTLTMRR